MDNHANLGMEFESELDALHDNYARSQKARIEKQYIPTRVVRGGALARVMGKSTVDYVGVIQAGRFVAFDAKDCTKNRIELSRLQEHQMQFLLDVDALDGLAFVLVRFPVGCWVVPVAAWKQAIEAHGGAQSVSVDGWTATGKASINAGELPDSWKVTGVDWLGVVVK